MISSTYTPKRLDKTPKKSDALFPHNQIQILFLGNDEEKYVEAYEANSISCSEIVEHLNRGESIFISNKSNKEKSKTGLLFEKHKDRLYLNRI